MHGSDLLRILIIKKNQPNSVGNNREDQKKLVFRIIIHDPVENRGDSLFTRQKVHRRMHNRVEINTTADRTASCMFLGANDRKNGEIRLRGAGGRHWRRTVSLT